MKSKKIVGYEDIAGDFVVYSSETSAAIANGYLRQGINRAVNTGTRYAGYYWADLDKWKRLRKSLNLSTKVTNTL